jgi:pyrroloquinoline quinone biosynthesis protein D
MLCLRNKARLIRRARTGAPLLVYPERALELNASAAEIVELLDGTRSLEEVIAELCKRHPDVPPEQIGDGVDRLVSALRCRALLDEVSLPP